jgi:hypothetical protein
MVTLADIYGAGHKFGSRIELTLYEGAEFDDGRGPAPTVDPHGFRTSSSMTEKAGNIYTGYIADIHSKKILLVFGWQRDSDQPDYTIGHVFAEYAAIHSFK